MISILSFIPSPSESGSLIFNFKGLNLYFSSKSTTLSVSEFAYEGDHLYDLRRWNRVITDVPEAAGITEEQAAFYPIPQAEIDLNASLR